MTSSSTADEYPQSLAYRQTTSYVQDILDQNSTHRVPASTRIRGGNEGYERKPVPFDGVKLTSTTEIGRKFIETIQGSLNDNSWRNGKVMVRKKDGLAPRPGSKVRA